MASKHHRVVEGLEIIDTAAKGKSLGKYENAIIFVNDTVPGDIVDVMITRKKKNYFEAKPLHFQKLSEFREEPFCAHFDNCGGCKWQNITYPKQLQLKEKIVLDAFRKIAGVPISIEPVIPSEKQTYYRNRLDFAFSNRRWLTEAEIADGETINYREGVGFHVPGRFDRVVDITKCYLQEEPSNKIRNGLRDFAQEHALSFFDNVTKKGLLRSLIIRTTTLGDVMVIMMFGEYTPPKIESVMQYLDSAFPEIDSLYSVINTKGNDTFFDLDLELLSGKPFIREKVGDVVLEFGPKSFFQTNPFQTPILFDVVKDFADIKPFETVFDLYCGVGAITLYLAKQSKNVVGFETVEEAVDFAKRNAKLNNNENASFYYKEIEKLDTEAVIAQHGTPDIIIADPPRSGMHPKAAENILKLSATRIVYVSCNPATQARDFNILKDHYNIEKVQPVDMFPLTPHVENVMLLKKR